MRVEKLNGSRSVWRRAKGSFEMTSLRFCSLFRHKKVQRVWQPVISTGRVCVLYVINETADATVLPGQIYEDARLCSAFGGCQRLQFFSVGLFAHRGWQLTPVVIWVSCFTTKSTWQRWWSESPVSFSQRRQRGVIWVESWRKLKWNLYLIWKMHILNMSEDESNPAPREYYFMNIILRPY